MRLSLSRWLKKSSRTNQHPSRRPFIEELESRESAATLVALTDLGFLLKFDSSTPQTPSAASFITGLGMGEQIVGIDFRPRTGQMFGIGVTNVMVGGMAMDQIRVFTIDVDSGVATLVPGSMAFNVTDGLNYGVDFNPTVDRIRVVNDANENFRINPNNGARADAPTPDTDLNVMMGGMMTPATQLVQSVAYDRSYDTGVAVGNRTTLYAIGTTVVGGMNQATLFTQGGVNQTPSPNTGTLLTVGSLGVNLAAGTSADLQIAGPATGLTTPNTGQAFAALTTTNMGMNTTSLFSVNLATGAATSLGAIVGGGLSIRGLAIVPENIYAIGTGATPGTDSQVFVYNSLTNSVTSSITPFAGFQGGVNVTTGDVFTPLAPTVPMMGPTTQNPDGRPEIVVGAAGFGTPGGAVKVFDSITGATLQSFFAYPGFFGGVSVATGDVNADGIDDIITGAGSTGGGGHVKVFNGIDNSQLASFFAYDQAFLGGIQVAAGDFNNDGRDEIVVSPGIGGQGNIKVFNGAGVAAIDGMTPFQPFAPFTSAALPMFQNSFLAFAGFNGGVNIDIGDVNGDGRVDIVASSDDGASGGNIKVFNGSNGQVLSSFFAFESSFTGGARVKVSDFTGDGTADILVTPGDSTGASGDPFNLLPPSLVQKVGEIRTFDFQGNILDQFFTTGNLTGLSIG
jgi:hypothetical protein